MAEFQPIFRVGGGKTIAGLATGSFDVVCAICRRRSPCMTKGETFTLSDGSQEYEIVALCDHTGAGDYEEDARIISAAKYGRRTADAKPTHMQRLRAAVSAEFGRARAFDKPKNANVNDGIAHGVRVQTPIGFGKVSHVEAHRVIVNFDGTARAFHRDDVIVDIFGDVRDAMDGLKKAAAESFGMPASVIAPTFKAAHALTYGDVIGGFADRPSTDRLVVMSVTEGVDVRVRYRMYHGDNYGSFTCERHSQIATFDLPADR